MSKISSNYTYTVEEPELSCSISGGKLQLWKKFNVKYKSLYFIKSTLVLDHSPGLVEDRDFRQKWIKTLLSDYYYYCYIL